jgi:DNA repair protein RecO (recombination protein O)
MTGARRKLLEPAWLLHHRPWSDTSLIIDLMTREHGRVTLFAHGARRPKSQQRAVLRPFVPLLVSWSGSADGGTLMAVEAAGGTPPLAPGRLISAFYLNELLMKLLPKEDRHETLHDAYGAALAALACADEQPALRAFERVLLEELGYGLDLAREAGSHRPLEADQYYHFAPGRGVLAARDGEPGVDIHAGRAMLAVARGELDALEAQRAARGIFGAAIAHCLEGRVLASRDVMLAMRRRGREG